MQMENEHNTKKLLDEYFMTRPVTTVKKIKGQIDRPELYEYEQKIGKSLVEMNSNEIAEMLTTFCNKSFSSNTYKLSYRSYDTLLSILRDFFNWYIDNYEIIKNPCNDKKIKGINAISLFNNSENVFTKEAMENAISKIRESQIVEYADYLETVIRMFYEGVPEAIEIVNLKKDDINHDKKTMKIRGREIQMSDRLYDLLCRVNRMESIPAHRGDYILLPYKNSYFKFPTREKFRYELEKRPPEYWGGHISRILNRELKNKLGININARTIYLLGFYDFLVRKCGEEGAKELILSVRDSEKTKKLMDIAHEYGIIEQNVTTLKKILIPFISG